MKIETIQADLIDEFSMFDDWMDRYEHMIDLGKSLPLIDSKFKTEDNIIKGCQSKVWLHADLENEKVVFSRNSPIQIAGYGNLISKEKILVLEKTKLLSAEIPSLKKKLL